MVKRVIFPVILLFVLGGIIQAQPLSLDYEKTPLNKVLIDIRDNYGVLFSFDDNMLSQYTVTVHKSFDDNTKAVEYLLKDFPLDFEKVENVFVIFPVKVEEKERKTCVVSGYVLEKGSDEPLPYSHIIINGKPLVSDITGYFSGKFYCDTLYNVKISHIGYFVLDTVMNFKGTAKVYLAPGCVKLNEVEIKGRIIDYYSQIGQEPGVMKLNSKVATHLPGFGDNSVFNLLRLQPGILAAGEQTNELIIWGSYAGQSMVLFDGFTVYNLKNFNDNISSFNPLMAKDIKVLKGGFDARYGERVGGIVDISGKNGNTQNFSFVFNLNNMTMNALFEIPIKKRSSLVIAFRHTYFNLYNPADYTVHRKDTAGNINAVDIHVVPNYVFRDINIKYSGKTKKDNTYYLSLYSGQDIFYYDINQQVYFRKILKHTQEKNRQFGGSFFYGKKLQNGGTQNFIVSSSSLRKEYFNKYGIVKLWSGETDTLDWEVSNNTLTEFHARTEAVIPIYQKHTLEWGAGLISNRSILDADTFGVNMSSIDMTGARLYFYLQDKISIGKHLTLRVGGRGIHVSNLHKGFLEPRLSAIVKLNEFWKINLATGIYNQFVAKSSVLDNEGNYHYLWAICDNADIPVQKAVHNVFSISFFKNNWTLSAESFYKITKGLSRYVVYQNIIPPGIYHGNSRSYGMDFMLKKEYKGHSAWIAYSLRKTEEYFDYFPDNNYRRAPQDQRHELKLSVLLNFDPLFVSANYVYGSGFPISYTGQQRVQPDYPYNRLDGSVSYKFINRKVKAEAGISVLNILNTENIKFSNFERIPLNQTSSINIYAQAIPFTPTIYLNVRL